MGANETCAVIALFHEINEIPEIVACAAQEEWRHPHHLEYPVAFPAELTKQGIRDFNLACYLFLVDIQIGVIRIVQVFKDFLHCFHQFQLVYRFTKRISIQHCILFFN